MFWFIPLIASAVSAIGGVVGQGIANMGRAEQERLLAASMDEMGKVDLPKLEALAAEQLGPSAMASVKTDPRLTGAQYSDLGQYRDIVNAGGLDLSAQADLNRATSRASRTAGGNINRIQEGLDARGAGNSAAGALLKAQAAQAENQQAHDSGLDAAAAAWQRRMDALGKHTQLAGGMRQQEFGEKARAAEAADAIARQNADYRTAAGRYRNQIAQQQYDNTYGKARDKASILAGVGKNAAEAGREGGNTAAALGNVAGTAINSYAQQSQAEDDRKWEADQRQKDRDAYSNPWGGW